MGLFDSFKKKEPEPIMDYDPLHVKITDIKKGFLVDYDLKTWIVVEEYVYDWGDDFFTKEYKLESGREIYFLSVIDDDELTLMLTQKVKLSQIDPDLQEFIIDNDKPPKTIEFDGKTFYRDSESPGYFKDESGDTANWIEFLAWDYYDESEEYVLSIEQWNDDVFECASGIILDETDISNIIPGHVDR